MIIVMQPDAGESAIAAVESRIRAEGLGVHIVTRQRAHVDRRDRR